MAICEQPEDPKLTKKLVKRGVIEPATPGIVMGHNILATKENNHNPSALFRRLPTGVALPDLPTR